MKKIVSLAVGILVWGFAASAAPANCEEHADTVKMSASGAVRTVTLVPAYDPDDESYDANQGVYFFKAKLERGKAYTVWTEGVGTNDNLTVMAYAADPSDESDADGPSADFEEVEEPGLDQRLILYADDWYIDDENPEESDPKEWTYYFEVNGEVGDRLTVNFVLGVNIPQGREDNPLVLTPTTTGSTVKRSLQTNNEYYMRARLQAGRMYWFATAGGTTNNVLEISVDGEDPADETKDPPTCSVIDDPAYEEDGANAGIYVVPDETGYFTIVVNGDDPNTDEDAASGAPFSFSSRLFAAETVANHTAQDLEVDAPPAAFTAGWENTPEHFANGIYDNVIDEALFRFPVAKGERYTVETTGAATNLLLRLYDAKGNVLVENAGDGTSLNVRAGVTAAADGFYFVGVCQNLEDLINDEPAHTAARVQVRRVVAMKGTPDAWDAADDTPSGATPLAPVPSAEGIPPRESDTAGHGWHQLGRTDWADVFQIAGRKGLVYTLGVSMENPEAAFNSLQAEVFTLSGTSERAVTVVGDVNAGAAMPLSFAATANATYYVRLKVAEGEGLDFPPYKLHASASSPEGAALGILTVNTHGTTAGTFSLGSETVKYPGGSSVLASGTTTVKFGAVAGFSTPAPQTVTVAAGATPTVVDVYYSDTFDPKDDAPATATAWTLKNVETTFARTLWPTDEADNFSFAGTDGYYYDLALRDVTGDAVFSITNAELGVMAENVTSVRELVLPKTKAKYILTVKHATAEKTGGAYTLAGFFANVGAIKFAKAAVSAKENAVSVALAVNRTAKDGVVRVKFATVDGTARAGVDYVGQSGILEWPNGDNKAKTITVKILPDLVAEYDGNKTFTVKLEPLPAAERGANEYEAAFLGGDTCTVTLTEVSRAGTTVATTYAAKAPKLATVTTEKVPLSSGTFYGVIRAAEGALTNGLPALASVTFTASTAKPAALSAKVALAGKTYSFSAKGWDEENGATCTKTFSLVQKVNNVAYTNTLAVTVAEGSTTNGVDWLKSGGAVTLAMNVPDANGKGVQPNIAYAGNIYRQNAKIQDYLAAVTNFTGYYTVALANPSHVGEGVPAGNGYLTLTIDNKGKVKVAGMLADGTTKPSLSVPAAALVQDAASANGYSLVLPLYFAKAPTCFGGLLKLSAASAANLPNGAAYEVVADARETLVWNNDKAALTYAGDAGWSLALSPCGGWYDTVFNLQTYYLGTTLSVNTAGILSFPAEVLPAGFGFSTAAEPNGFALDLQGDKIAYAKKVQVKNGALVDLEKSENICNVAVKFARATGLYSGTCGFWCENETGTAQKQLSGVKFFGVLVLARDVASPLAASEAGAGFMTLPVKLSETDEATGRTMTRAWTFSAPFNLHGEED